MTGRGAGMSTAGAPDQQAEPAKAAEPVEPVEPVERAEPVPVSVRDALALAQPLLGERPLLVVSDFDGTLSPIVMDPWGARIVPLARRALRRISAAPGVRLALLSGRTAADLASRVRVGGAIYLGNHGLERGELRRRGRAERLVVLLEGGDWGEDAASALRIAQDLPRLVPEPWLVVEAKPPAVAFHYRNAPDTEEASRRVAAAVEILDPGGRFVRFPGRRVLELRPPGSRAKGEALRALLDEIRPAAALMLGDDRSDALAFEILRAAREAGEVRGLNIAVHAHAEAPAGVAAAADVVLGSPRDAARFIAGLGRRL